ncbi:MAG: hypothetical protein OJF62_002151 [Pseudolabrys sp.]|nr:hypothetical protein [Pseudolabrys sp.]
MTSSITHQAIEKLVEAWPSRAAALRRPRSISPLRLTDIHDL